MEIFNRITLEKSVYKRPDKVDPVTLRANKAGKFVISRGLDNLLGNPSHVQFIRSEGVVYIVALMENQGGMELIRNSKNKSVSFGFSELLKVGLFTPGVTYVAFTDSVYLNLSTESDPNMIQAYPLISHAL